MSIYDGISLVIASIAMVAAVYSIFYTHRFNRPRLSIDQVYYEKRPDRPTEIMFSLNNISPVSITVLNLSILSDGKEVIPVDYEPVSDSLTIISSYEYASPLVCPCDLLPYSQNELSYYIDNDPVNLSIELSCNKRICRFRKGITLPIHPVQLN